MTSPASDATTRDNGEAGEPQRLPRRVILQLSVGHGGLSILINLLGILLVFFYLPPDSAGLPQLVTDKVFLFALNAIALIVAAGRLSDAITDPLVAFFSDKSTHKKGRRIPFMAIGAIPAAIGVTLMFFPPVGQESGWNIIWLLALQIPLFVSLTMYATPAFSLVADLGRTPDERLDLATMTSVLWAVGIVIAAMTTPMSALFQSMGASPIRSWQIAVAIVCSIALVAMLFPVVTLDEPRWSRSEPSAVPLKASLEKVASNPFFRFYLAADFAYFCGLTIIQTGMLFYVTVLLELDEGLTALYLLLMVILALGLYPIVNKIAKARSGKQLVIFAFAISSLDFAAVIFLGQYPIPNWLQAGLIIAIFSIPFAILSVIPGWILADIAEHSAKTTGDATAAMFFAARTFMQKISQTVGVIVFALLTSFGRDVGDDLGIRLSGLAGVILYAGAAVLFFRYNEKRLQSELAAADESVVASLR